MSQHSRVLVFTKSIPNSGRLLEPPESEVNELSGKANRAVDELGPDWKITSAVTNMTHFEMGNLLAIGLTITVVVVKE